MFPVINLLPNPIEIRAKGELTLENIYKSIGFDVAYKSGSLLGTLGVYAAPDT